MPLGLLCFPDAFDRAIVVPLLCLIVAVFDISLILTELDDVRKRIYQTRLIVVSCFLRRLSSLGVLPKVSLQT